MPIHIHIHIWNRQHMMTIRWVTNISPKHLNLNGLVITYVAERWIGEKHIQYWHDPIKHIDTYFPWLKLIHNTDWAVSAASNTPFFANDLGWGLLKLRSLISPLRSLPTTSSVSIPRYKRVTGTELTQRDLYVVPPPKYFILFVFWFKFHRNLSRMTPLTIN